MHIKSELLILSIKQDMDQNIQKTFKIWKNWKYLQKKMVDN